MKDSNSISTVTIFCGSNYGSNPLYKKKAEELGIFLAENKLNLVYGGSNVGLMNVVANAVISNKGTAIGVITNLLKSYKLSHRNLSQLIEVETLAERKEKMIELADAIIVLPGGFGTLDELFEIITLNQLGITSKPVALFNILGYYSKLVDFLNFSVNQTFIKQDFLDKIIISDNVKELFEALNTTNFSSNPLNKWSNI